MKRTRGLIGDLHASDSVAIRHQRDGKAQQVRLQAESKAGVMMWYLNGEAVLPHCGHEGDERLHGIIDPCVEMEIARSAPMAGCSDNPENGRFTRLRQACRWSGLGLAEINPGLGYYFATEAGVLVLRDVQDGIDLLKVGDLIIAVDGKAMTNLRDVMRALASPITAQTTTLTR